jgi:hypothetical protein
MGPMEQGVRLDLREFPEPYCSGAIAQGALFLARELDEDLDARELSARDAGSHVREIRQSIAQLHEMAPREGGKDATDNARDRRALRLA